MDENGTLPVGIVNLVIEKIAAFTKELEILRAQLPERSQMNARIDSGKQTTIDEASKLSTKMDTFGEKLKSTLTTIKVVASLIGLVVLLSMFGAKLINYFETKKDPHHMIIEKQMEEFQKTTDDKFEQILRQIRELHKRDKIGAGDGDDL
jgi:hypothetical protein